MWYDVNKTLSHNCLLNFVVGPRGVGKTYAAKNRAIRNFLSKRTQFVYLRRYETELKADKIEMFFNDIEYAFPDHAFATKFGKFYIDSKVAGYYMPLSKAAQYKSTPFPNVELIIFDEFIIDQGMLRYLPNEVINFNEMYSTIARLRDVRVLFLSNAITFTNPYFLFFNLNLQQGQKILKKGDILLEVVDNPDYMQAAASTRFGKIIEGTEYGDYAFRNQFLRDKETFVSAMDEAGVYLFTLKVNDMSFGVYSKKDSSLWYVSENVDLTSSRVISADISGHDKNSKFSKESSAKMWLDELKQRYYRAELRFTTLKAQNIVTPVLKKTI